MRAKTITRIDSIDSGRNSPAINRLKARLGVPRELASCHTAEVEGYVIRTAKPRLVDYALPVSFSNRLRPLARPTSIADGTAIDAFDLNGIDH